MKLSAKLALLGAAAALGIAASASATVVTMNFDTVTRFSDIDNFYNGGTDSQGGSGPNYGVAFKFFNVSWHDFDPSNFAVGQELNSVINVTRGFSDIVNFTYGNFSPTIFRVFSGLDGTGTELASNIFIGDPALFVPGSLSFSGVARSFVVSGARGGSGIDNLSMDVLPVPEPQSWAMLLGGLALLGGMARRRA